MESLRGILGPEAAPQPPSFAHRSPEYAQAQRAPIVESAGPVALPTGGAGRRLKYYWFGVVSVELTTGFECDFEALSPQSYRWMNAPEVEEAAEQLLRSRLDRCRSCLIKPSPKWLDEDYLVIDIESARHPDGRSANAAEMLQCHADLITQLVRGELPGIDRRARGDRALRFVLLSQRSGGGRLGRRPCIRQT